MSYLLDCALLGCILALVLHYPALIHASDSHDVVRAAFLIDNACFRLKPRIVTCEWYERSLNFPWSSS